jgi:hypothetical protein
MHMAQLVMVTHPLHVEGVIGAWLDLDGHQTVGRRVRERHAARCRCPVIEATAQREQRHNDRIAVRAHCADCLKHFRRRVGEAGLLDGAELDRVESEVAALIDQAVEVARAAPSPDSEALLRDVYVSY